MTALLNYSQLSPAPFKALVELENAIKKANLPHGLIHLLKIRASQLNGCTFCVDMHTKEARKDDESSRRLHHIAVWHESQLFSPAERAALAWTEALTEVDPREDKEPLFTALRAHFSDAEISDMTFVIGTINIWNRLSVAFKSVPGSLDKLYGLDKVEL